MTWTRLTRSSWRDNGELAVRLLLPLAAFTVGLVTGAVGCETGAASEAIDSGAADVATGGDGRRDAEPPVDTECRPKAPAGAGVPAPYAGLRSPLVPTPSVMLAGRTRFSQRCVLCHGERGGGDGREGPFVPPAADLADAD